MLNGERVGLLSAPNSIPIPPASSSIINAGKKKQENIIWHAHILAPDGVFTNISPE